MILMSNALACIKGFETDLSFYRLSGDGMFFQFVVIWGP